MAPAEEQVAWRGAGCTPSGCHLHIEPIRQLDTGMMKAIMKKGAKSGDRDGCIVSHGGNPSTATARAAHVNTVVSLRDDGGPDEFFPDPAVAVGELAHVRAVSRDEGQNAVDQPDDDRIGQDSRNRLVLWFA
jgi:hypothetical protein